MGGARDQAPKRIQHSIDPPSAGTYDGKMCIVLMHLRHPDFAFIAASNRDEFLARPTAASHWHNFPPPSAFEPSHDSSTPSLSQSNDGAVQVNGAVAEGPASRPSSERPILSGIDVHAKGGGTWIGLSRTGRFAALTNFTEPAPPPLPKGRGLDAYRSRGTLARGWFERESRASEGSVVDDLDDYLSGVAAHMDEWPGFNFLAGQLLTGKDGRSGPRIGYVTNRSKEDGAGVHYLPTGEGQQGDFGLACAVPDAVDGTAQPSICDTVGLSNSVLQQPWSKVLEGQKRMDEALRRYDERKREKEVTLQECREKLAYELFDVLATEPDDNVAPHDLPHSIIVRPIRRNETSGWYATRTSTVMLVERQSRNASSDSGLPLEWWERDIHVINTANEPVRCDTRHQRYYQANLLPPA